MNLVHPFSRSQVHLGALFGLGLALFGLPAEAAPSPQIVGRLQVGKTSPKVAAIAAEHVELGFPSAAARTSDNDYLLVRKEYVLSYNRSKNALNWASWKLTPDHLGNSPRTDAFRPDVTLPTGWLRADDADYHGSGYHRGHIVRSRDRMSNLRSNSKTFVYTNIVPQYGDANMGPWNGLENYYLDLVKAGHHIADVQSGTLYENASTTIGKGIAVPSALWKIVTLRPNSTDPLDPAKTRVIAVIVPNEKGKVRLYDNWSKFRVSVAEIERRTGYKFFETLPTAVADQLRQVVDKETIPYVHPRLWREQKPPKLLLAGQQGRLKYYDPERGFGFVERPNQPDLFLHVSNVEESSVESLKMGVNLEFDVGEATKGNHRFKAFHAKVTSTPQSN